MKTRNPKSLLSEMEGNLGEGWFPHSCRNNLEPTTCPRCQSCHIKHIILVPSQMVVVLPRKTPVLQHLCTHFRIYFPKPLPLGSVQESTPFRPSTSLSWAWFLRAPFCFQITAPAPALWKVSSSPPRNYSQHCHGTQEVAPPVHQAAHSTGISLGL